MCSFDSNGRYLSLADEEFSHNVFTDIIEFLENKSDNSVLLFPPVSNYRRFLIHDTCENIKTKQNQNIISFSIGEKYQRRTVICYEHQLINKSFLKRDDNKTTNNYEEKPEGAYSSFFSYRTKEKTEKNMGIKNISSDEFIPNRGNKTNSIALYRPPAARQTNNTQKTTSPVTGTIDVKTSFDTNLENKSETTNSTDEIKNNITIKPEEAVTNTNNSTNKIITKRQRERRPDRAVYIPRAKRSQTTPTYKVNTEIVQSDNIVNNEINTENKKSENNKKELNEIKKTTTNIHIKNSNLDENNKLKKLSEEKILQLNHNHKNNETDQLHSPPINNRPIVKTENQNKIKNFDQQFSYHQEKNQNIIPTQNHQTIEKSTGKMENDKSNNSIRIEDTKYNKKDKREDDEELEFRRASQEINRSNRRIIKQTFNDNVLTISEPVTTSPNKQKPTSTQNTLNTEDNDWEELYDENGECLEIKVMEELTSAVGKVNIEKPKLNYENFEMKQEILNNEEFPHVLEVSNFPVEFKTQDLMMLFNEYKERGFDIKWVDDTHALAVFSSSRVAAEVLSMNHPFVQLKPLGKATVESRTKAKKCSSHLLPYRQRPETCAALARRLVTGALGVKLKTSREERENEKRVLKEAKEKKLLAAKQQKEMWEG